MNDLSKTAVVENSTAFEGLTGAVSANPDEKTANNTSHQYRVNEEGATESVRVRK